MCFGTNVCRPRLHNHAKTTIEVRKDKGIILPKHIHKTVK